jgi:hypothetical protein
MLDMQQQTAGKLYACNLPANCNLSCNLALQHMIVAAYQAVASANNTITQTGSTMNINTSIVENMSLMHQTT